MQAAQPPRKELSHIKCNIWFQFQGVEILLLNSFKTIWAFEQLIMITIKVKIGDIFHDLAWNLRIFFHIPGLRICQTRLQVFTAKGFLGGMMGVWYFVYSIFFLCAALGKVQYLKVWEIHTRDMLWATKQIFNKNSIGLITSKPISWSRLKPLIISSISLAI